MATLSHSPERSLKFLLGGLLSGSLLLLASCATSPGPVNMNGQDQLNQNVSPSPSAQNLMAICLDEQSSSGESGSAILTEVSGGVRVDVYLNNAPAGVSQPAHIHIGSCPSPAGIRYNLSNVVNGISSTTLPVSLADLQAQLPLALNVHRSTNDLQTYVSCGDLITLKSATGTGSVMMDDSTVTAEIVGVTKDNGRIMLIDTDNNLRVMVRETTLGNGIKITMDGKVTYQDGSSRTIQEKVKLMLK